MKRLVRAALLASILVIVNFLIIPRTTPQASGCDDRTGGISWGARSGCPMPLWRQGPTAHT
jgi:hypothetical protein